MEFMLSHRAPLAESVERFLASRPRTVRWLEWLAGRRYRLAAFPDRERPVVVIASRERSSARAEQVAHAIEHDWLRPRRSATMPTRKSLNGRPG